MLSPQDLLRPDNHDLFDEICARLNQRPVVPFETIAAELGCSVDQLVRFVAEHKLPPRQKSFYQSPRFAALRPPFRDVHDAFAAPLTRQRETHAQRARDGARATRLANAELEGRSR